MSVYRTTGPLVYFVFTIGKLWNERLDKVQGKSQHKTLRSKNHKAIHNKNHTRTTVPER